MALKIITFFYKFLHCSINGLEIKFESLPTAERDRERQRDRERERQRERETETETETERERDRDRETERQRQRERQRDKERGMMCVYLSLSSIVSSHNGVTVQCRGKLKTYLGQ